MDDLESRLDHQLSGLGRVPLAEPEPVGGLRRRARRVRVGRAITGAVAVATAIGVIGAAVVATRNGRAALHKVEVAAPDFVLGDIDAVVLSSTVDEDGARAPLPPSLVAAVAKVPGVRTVNGVVDTFAQVTNSDDQPVNSVGTPTVPPRSPILFSYHEGDDLHLTSGRPPQSTDEVMLDADVMSRYHVSVGQTIRLFVHNTLLSFRVTGEFELPGVDLAGVPLAAMSVAHQPTQLQPDRLDVRFTPGADAAKVRDAIAAALSAEFTVVPPSVISFPDQRLAQVEIQHAYWSLLSPDQAERSASGDGPPSAQEKANYERYASLSNMVELRVENVSFLSPDAASLTFRIYYGSAPSPIINDPQTGTATRVAGHWQLGKGTLCSLAAVVGIKCDAGAGVTVAPPNGYQPVSTLDPAVLRGFGALADPGATIAQRSAAIQNAGSLQSIIASGVNADRAFVGKTNFTIAGWRSTGSDRLNLLYSLQTAGGPSTPWPTTAVATKGSDGHWYASSQYACGLRALAEEECTLATPPAGGFATAVTAPAVAASP